MIPTPPHVAAHANSAHHRREIMQSAWCGCFYCCAIFEPIEIHTWIDASDTALCPRCGIDSVIGDGSRFPIEPGFLDEMRRHWFEREASAWMTLRFLDPPRRAVLNAYRAPELAQLDVHWGAIIENVVGVLSRVGTLRETCTIWERDRGLTYPSGTLVFHELGRQLYWFEDALESEQLALGIFNDDD